MARLGGALVSLATAIVILGASVLPLLTPFWIDFAQDRAGAASLTGYPPTELRRVTDSIVHDLLFGGDFDVATAGAVPVLDANERAHMRDVRAVFAGLGLLVLVSAGFLLVTAWRARAPEARAAAWRAVRQGASSLAVLLVVLGVIAIVAFDALFEVFHRVLFPGGNYTFDPTTEKLVQLFPMQFWSETALAYGAVAIVFALGVSWHAGRRVAA